MGNHSSNSWQTIRGRRGNLLSAANAGSQNGKELEFKQQQCESKPKHGIKTRQKHEQFLDYCEFEKKGQKVKLQGRDQRRLNSPAVNVLLREEVKQRDQNHTPGIFVGSLSNPESQPNGDNCKSAETRNENECMTGRGETIGIDNSTLGSETTEGVTKFKKCLNVIKPSQIKRRRNTNKKRIDVDEHASSATMNHTPSSTITNQVPSTASRRRFCILNKRDKNSLRAQISIWFPYVCHKPTLKALQDSFIRMKCNIVKELRKLEIIDFNKHITESKEQRNLFRKEHLRERCSKCKPIYYISSIVPECQKGIGSLNFDSSNCSLTPGDDAAGKYDKELKSINYKINGTNNLEGYPFTGNERHWRHNLMYLSCDKLQMATQCEVPANVNDLKHVKQFEEEEIKQFYIPEWFQTMLKKEVIINIHPACPNEQKGPSSEIKQLMGCQRRLKLGHIIHNSDFSSGDGCLVMSVREQEVKSPGDIDEQLTTKIQTTNWRSHFQQKEVEFERGSHEDLRRLGVSMPLDYKYMNYTSKCSPASDGSLVESFRRRLRWNRASAISNYKSHSYKKLSMNTERTQEKEDSHSSSAEDTHSKLGNYVSHESSWDMKQPRKDVYQYQSSLLQKETSSAILSASDSTFSPICPEINDATVGEQATHVLPETKLAERKTAARLKRRKYPLLDTIIPEVNTTVRKKSQISFKMRQMNTAGTGPNRNAQKENESWSHSRPISVHQKRSKSCGLGKCGQLGRNTRKDRSWVRELRNVPITDVTEEEVNCVTFETASASKGLITNTLLDNDIIYFENNTNLGAKMYPKINKTRSDNVVRRIETTIVDKMNRSNSSVHGVQGVFECSQAIVVDDVMDSQQLCMNSNAESKSDNSVLIGCDQNTDTSVGTDVTLVDNVNEPLSLCIATDTESKLNQVILVQSGEDAEPSSPTNFPTNSPTNPRIIIDDGVDLHAVSMICGTESNLEQTPRNNLDKEMKSKVAKEIISRGDVIQSREIHMGISIESKSDQIGLIEPRENVTLNTLADVNDTRVHLEQPHSEQDACVRCLNSDKDKCFRKSTFVNYRQTTETHLNNNVKMPESETPLSHTHDINCLENKRSENEFTAALLNLREHEFQNKKTSVLEKTDHSNENNESTDAASSNTGKKSSRESLIDFIQEQWRSCKTPDVDPIIYEKQAALLKVSRHFSSNDVSQRASPAFCPDRKPFLCDVEGKTHSKHHNVQEEQSYETMCSERRENYLKICRALENYYESSCQEYFNNISSISTKNPQARERNVANSQRKLQMPTNILSPAYNKYNTPIKIKMPSTNSTPSTARYERDLQPDYKNLNSFIESNTQSLNSINKQTISTRNCNVKVNKLSKEKIFPEVTPDHQGFDTDMSQDQVNHSPSSLCANATNQNLLSNTAESEYPTLDKPNDERKWLMNKIKTSLPTNTSREDFSILTALDKLLERYFRSIEELQERLENCNTRVLKFGKRRKNKQKRDNKLPNLKNERQKKQKLSESALNLYQSLSYERFNSQVMVEDAYSELKHGNFVKSLAWNCSVNNKQDSQSDSIPSDIDLIEPTPKSYMSKKRQSSTEPTSGKDSQLDDPIHHDADVDEPKILNEVRLVSPDGKTYESPVADDIASRVETSFTPSRDYGTPNKQQREQIKTPRLQSFGTARTSLDSGALTRFTSRLSLTSEYPEIQQTNPTSPRYKKRATVSDRASTDYSTRDFGTTVLENQLLGGQRKVYSPIYDKDSNNRPTFLNDGSVGRRRTTEKQECYNLTTTEQEYMTQPIYSRRHLSPDYVDSEWTPVSSKIPELLSSGKSGRNTEGSRKYFSTSAESRAYYSGGTMSRDPLERREFTEKAKYVPTFNSQTRIPDYCLNQTRCLSRATDRTTSPCRAAILNACQKLEKRNKRQDTDPCQLSPAQMWFRDLYERVNTKSRINGEVTPQSRRTHDDKCGENLRFEARICVPPTVCCPAVAAQRNIHNTLGGRDVRISPGKGYDSSSRSLQVDNRHLDPSKNYIDIALLENPTKNDSNIRARQEDFHDYIYSQVKSAETPVENKDIPFSRAVLEALQPLQQTEQYKMNTGTQSEVNQTIASRVDNPRQETTRSNPNTTKECAHVCIQTCACISKPNGTCLCGYISLNEIISPNIPNEYLAQSPERKTEEQLNFKSVFIQTYDAVQKENRMEKPVFKKGKKMVKAMRLRQSSPNKIKCRNKKCQVGLSVQCKNECTGIGASLSNGLPCKTVATHCHRYDTGQNTLTTMTKCVQTCSFSEIRNNKRLLREEKIICCKCKEKLDTVMAKQFETPDLSSELATDSYDKECQCDNFTEYIMPELEAAAGQESIHPYSKYQTKPPYLQNRAYEENNVEDRLASEDGSDEEWVQEVKKTEPTSRYGPSQAERLPHHPTDSGNACTISHELTEQISGIIRNSRLLQQQAVLLRNKCKYLEGQGWTSINQNRHEALRACRSKKCVNVLRCHHFKKNPNKNMDTNNNANTELDQNLYQPNRMKCFNKLSSYVCFRSNQWAPYKNDYVTDTAGSYYRQFIRRYLSHKENFQRREYFQRKQKNKNRNWNAKPRKLPEDVTSARISQKLVYKHPEREGWFINDPSEEAYQYMRTHFPGICTSAPNKKNPTFTAHTQVPCHNHKDESQNKEYTKHKQLCEQYSSTRQTSDVVITTPGSCICSTEQNLCEMKFNGNLNLSIHSSKNSKGRTKSQNNANSGEETALISHNGETVNVMDQERHQDIYSVCSDVISACHNKSSQPFSLDNDSVQEAPANESWSSSALRKNYWQLAYTIGSISGARHPGRHAWNHDVSQSNRQSQGKASGEDGVGLPRQAPPAVVKDLTRSQSLTEAHNNETHHVSAMGSSTNLQQPFQEHIPLPDDTKIVRIVEPGSSCYQDKDDASMSYLSSPQTVSPDTNIPHYVGYCSCDITKDSAGSSVKVMKKPHSLCHNCGNISDICGLSKHRHGILKLEEKAEQSPEASSSNASLISVKIVPNQGSGVHVLKEIFLDVKSTDIANAQRSQPSCEAVQHVFSRDISHILTSDTSHRQGDDQLQLWEKNVQIVPENIKNFECESSSMADYVPLQKGQCLPNSGMKCPSKLKYHTSVLDSQDSNLGIEDIPLKSTLSEHERGSDPIKLKEHKRSNAFSCKSSKVGRKETVLIKRPLSVVEQDKSCSYLSNPRMKLTSPECKDSILPEWKSVVGVENAVAPIHITVMYHHPANVHRQQVRAGTPKDRVVKRSEVNDVEEESSNEQVVSWWNSPECLQERRIPKDKAKYISRAFRSRPPTFLDKHDPSVISKNFENIPNSSSIKRSRCADVHERDSLAIASHLEYSRDNKPLEKMSNEERATLRNNHRSNGISACKANYRATSNKWRTCFSGYAEVIEANDQRVSIVGSYIRKHSSLQKQEDCKIHKVHTKKVKRDRFQWMDTDPKVVQFRLVLSRNEGSGDSAEIRGIYSRQLLTSRGYFNWEFIV